MFSLSRVLPSLAVLLVMGLPIGAAPIVSGTYRLYNHPDVPTAPPPAGMRFDELFDVIGSQIDVFTLDFEYSSGVGGYESDVRMDVEEISGSPDRYTIRIYGSAYGGIDRGPALGEHQGVYEIYFEYVVGAQVHPADDDLVVDPSDFSAAQGAVNSGWIRTPLGDTVDLFEAPGSGFSFRLGDEDDDLGHAGYSGLSGWGLLDAEVPHPGATREWFFAAVLIPAPAAVPVLVFGGLCGARRTRRGKPTGG